jgi:hypothetical protein
MPFFHMLESDCQPQGPDAPIVSQVCSPNGTAPPGDDKLRGGEGDARVRGWRPDCSTTTRTYASDSSNDTLDAGAKDPRGVQKMESRDVQISLGAAMITIAVVAVFIAVILALREEPLVADSPYVPSSTSDSQL